MFIMAAADALMLPPPPGRIDWIVRPPGSKSLTNRALLAAALAVGDSELDRILIADDCRLMIQALRALGVPVESDEVRRKAFLTGRGGRWPIDEAALDCGNAGTVMRFMTAACALGYGDYILDGSDRMRRRPMHDLVTALRQLGAAIAYECEEGYCPLHVRASGLRGGVVRVDQPVSSQFVSALLLAAPLASNDVMIEVTGPLPSGPYVKMTVAVMQAFGVAVVEHDLRRFIVPAPQRYTPCVFSIEPDASSASYFFAAAAITGGQVTVEGVGSQSVQGDMGFVRVLERMGCVLDIQPSATTLRGPADGRLIGIDADLAGMPDTAQTLAVLAAFADGPTRIRNVANLRIKETDRLHALATELGRMDVATEIHADGITICPRKPPVACQINTYDDHRMAMSFAVAGLRLDGMEIRDPSCVKKSYPEFFEIWLELIEG